MARDFARARKGFVGLKLIVTSGGGKNYDEPTKTVTKPTLASFTELEGIIGEQGFTPTANTESDPEFGKDDPITDTAGVTKEYTAELFYDMNDTLHNELRGVLGLFKGVSSNTIINTDDEAIIGYYPDESQASGSRRVIYAKIKFGPTTLRQAASGKMRMTISGTLSALEEATDGA